MKKPSKRSHRNVIGKRTGADIREPIPDGTISRLATIGQVPKDKLRSLRHLIHSAQAEAFRAHGVGRRKHLTSSDVRPHFARLRKSLEALLPERKGEPAGVYLGAVIAPQSIEDWLEAVARAERHAIRMLPGRGAAKGPRGAPGFRLFTAQVVLHVKELGGKQLNCQRMSGADYDKIKGSYAEVLELLRDYLPVGFIPKSAHSIVKTFEFANKLAI